jgi:Histidine kinase-, DNA gyrase B-, and HSP90-like ATPase
VNISAAAGSRDAADWASAPYMSIRRLPEHLVNRIAAGEVVERPAAALKELVENAVDAGATRIDIMLGVGGTARIDVRDDGCGMTADDIALALERQSDVICGHAAAIVTDINPRRSPHAEHDVDPCCTGINGVFDEFLERCRRTFDNFTCSNAINQVFGQATY